MKRSTRKALALAAAVAALALAGQSAAAQLGVSSARPLPVLDSWARCGTSATATITGTAVTVSGLAAGCDGTAVVAYVHSTGGTQTASGTVNGTGANLTLPAAPGTVDNVLVRVGTWALATTWTQPTTTLPLLSCIGTNGGKDCTATVTGITSWGYPTANNYLLNIEVSTTSNSQVKWEVTINLSHSSLPFVATDLSDVQGGLVKVSSTACSATPRTVTVKGTTNWGNYDRVTNGNPVSMQVQGTLSGAGSLINC